MLVKTCCVSPQISIEVKKLLGPEFLQKLTHAKHVVHSQVGADIVCQFFERVIDAFFFKKKNQRGHTVAMYRKKFQSIQAKSVLILRFGNHSGLMSWESTTCVCNSLRDQVYTCTQKQQQHWEIKPPVNYPLGKCFLITLIN